MVYWGRKGRERERVGKKSWWARKGRKNGDGTGGGWRGRLVILT